MRANSQLQSLKSRRSVCLLCNFKHQESLSILWCFSLHLTDMRQFHWAGVMKKPQKIESLMHEKFLFCFLNSLTGISWRVLRNSQVSLMTWEQLRRRWVLMVISLWTFFSSLITCVQSRWAEQFCCTVTERNIHLPTYGYIYLYMEKTTKCQYRLIPVGTLVPFYAAQKVSRNSMAFLKSKMWSQPCSRMKTHLQYLCSYLEVQYFFHV